jgi:hypothetical protein
VNDAKLQPDPLGQDKEKEAPEPQPASSGAGRRGPPTAIGTGYGDEGGAPGQPPGESASRWYNLPIEDLNLTMRTYNCLRRQGVMTVGQVLSLPEQQLFSFHNFSRACYTDLRRGLDELGILPLDAAFGWPGN